VWYNGCCEATLTTGDGVKDSVLIQEMLDKLPVPELEQSLTTFLAPLLAVLPDRRLQRVVPLAVRRRSNAHDHHASVVVLQVYRPDSAGRGRRVLLAGDAAHVHYPVGGQGLNTGVQDAVNLGWKLAQVVNRTSPERLLDTYHAERHPVAAIVLRTTMAQVALLRTDDRTNALRDTVSELLGMDEPRKRVAAMLSGLDLQYDLGAGHPLLGRRMPDLDLVTATGPLRVFTLLHAARPVLLNLGAPGGFDITPWAHRVRLIDATYMGTWELPVIGAVTAPTAVLVRPDGYVAWVGDRTQLGLVDALTTWFGPPRAA